VSRLTIAFLLVAAAGIAMAPALRKRAEAGRRRLTSAEFDAAYKRSAHTSEWTYPPRALWLLRASMLCVFLAWLALLGVYLSLRD
jgi:hypothetical protein